MSQVIWPGQMPAGPASPLARNPRWPFGHPVGTGEAARAASAAGQAATTSPASTPAADDATYIEFDVPGSSCQAAFFFCTTPTGINPGGVVTGYYADASQASHGFVRNSDGSFNLFDPPGSLGTIPYAINPQGAIAGGYGDAVTGHGFLRMPDGTITTLDPPGSAATVAFSINPAGTIVGEWQDSTFAIHGFLTTDGSTYTSFDVADAAVNGYFPISIDQTGTIVGTYFDVFSFPHGFVRTPGGAITTFDAPATCCTNAVGTNPDGTIVGWYVDHITFFFHGFLRSKDGTFTTFDAGGIFTFPSSINAAGTVTGNYLGFTGLVAFVRDKHGAVTTFDPPGSNMTSSFTFANAINPAGVITGSYIDPSFLGHGFIRIPH
jgi:uncharacterized membrane protein